MTDTATIKWIEVAPLSEFEVDGGKAVIIEGKQIAVYYFQDRDEWYATDNECPHQKQQALSRGMIGSDGDEPKVACPFHKKSFSLKSGKCLSGEDYEINTYPVKVEGDLVYIGLD
ncbi:nitrite reductase small subunit NirD [Labilibacter marinus]|uniref:nitrite reductase small subunit NirD n=1 Tax=Labilibacter marinus TaxID=1477105 RepID=UPI00094FCD82|nr:nitrite reductase small subunit NirD [Labilibacter marinus]